MRTATQKYFRLRNAAQDIFCIYHSEDGDFKNKEDLWNAAQKINEIADKRYAVQVARDLYWSKTRSRSKK